MSINPINMQMMINKASDVNRVNNDQQRMSEEQEAFSNQLKKEAEHDAQKTIKSTHTEEQSIKDGQSGNKGQYSKKDKGKKNEDEEKVKKNKSTSLFDVSI